MAKWTEQDIPDQTGKRAIVTGANSGIGYETAKMLAAKGADITLACRSEKHGIAALEKLQAAGYSERVRLELVDLSSFASIVSFAEGTLAEELPLDCLINNAGVMFPPESKTEEGFELQFGVNHLGHFALTARLFPLLLQKPGSRVVNVSSLAHKGGRINIDNLRSENGYAAIREYSQSKLANLLFTFELQRRLETASIDMLAVAAHPGGTKTDLQRHSGFVNAIAVFMGMPAAQGALPTLRAAVDPSVKGAEYYGPHALFEMRGYPVKAKIAKQAKDTDVAKRLWDASVELTGVSFEGL